MHFIKKRLFWLLFPFAISIAAALVACTFRPMDYYKVSFDQNVCIEPYSAYTYRTGNSFVVTVNEEHFTIPKHFETDLASIPRWYWMVLAPQYSAFVQPSVIHDYFYRCANLKSRKFADDVFYYALIQQGVSRYTASKFYLAVRVFGAHSYSKTIPCNKDEDGNIEKDYPRPRRLEIVSI